MSMDHRSLRSIALAAGLALLTLSTVSVADPPSRVGRLGYMTGAVSLSPAGESDWVVATINRPLTTGDRLWADAGSRTELQIGGAAIRMNAGTGVSILNLDDRITQLQLTQGTLNIRVRRLEPNQAFEVDTPNLALTLRQPGDFRIEVDPEGNATTIIVRRGQAEVYGEGASYLIDARQPYRFMGAGLREYRYVDVPRIDEFDRWAGERDRSYDNSISARYVSQDVVGYQDLDANGTWRVDATYGNVWFPSRVGADWAPYRDGHWAWVDPWGWTWVDDAPWGFAVSHYGRWTNLQGSWGWVPGPVRSRAYYAPALVAFIGGDQFQLSIASGNVGGIAWFPLGPREVYRPSYAVSRGYFENINRSNTVINTTVINNYYNNTNVTNVVYANRGVPGAVVAVPTTVFVQSQPVSRAAVRVRQEAIASAPVAVVPALAPTERSVRGASSPAGTPPTRVFERPVVARTAPPAVPAGFAAQQRQLEAKPGKPLDDATRRQLRPDAAAAPAPAVRVVEPVQKGAPTMRPPPMEATARPAPGRSEPSSRGSTETRDPSSAPPPPRAGESRVPSPSAPQAKADQRSPTVQPTEQREKSEARGNAEPRRQPTAPPPPPQRASEPKSAAPPATTPEAVQRSPAAQPPEQRGKSTAQGNAEPRGRPTAPPPPQRAAEPKPVAPPAAPAAQAAQRPPTAQPPEQRAKSDARGNGESRGQPTAAPPPQRAAEPRPVPSPAPTPQAARPAGPAAQQPAPKAQPPSSPQADPRDQRPKGQGGKPSEKGKDSEDAKQDEDNRKPKG